MEIFLQNLNNTINNLKTQITGTRIAAQTKMFLEKGTIRKPSIKRPPQKSKKILYACTVCTKMFSKVQLRYHIRLVHSGVKTYKCKMCDFVTDNPHNYKVHKGFAHKLQPKHECKFCNMKFKQLNLLKKHVKMKIQTCSICKLTFNFNCQFKKHTCN